MNKNTVVLTFGSIILIFVFLFGAYFMTNKTPAPATQQQSSVVNEKMNATTSSDHAKWSANKKILLVEYGDLQCPACKAWHDYLTQLEASQDPQDKKIVENITFVYRHFPLLSVHPNAQEAAWAAEAAGRQDKFFEYADLLYNQQDEWAEQGNPTKSFETYAQDLELDLEQFKADMRSKEVKDAVESQRTSGIEAAVVSTPTFYLQGRQVQVTNFDEFHTLLLEALK